MSDNPELMVIGDEEAKGLFDGACNAVRYMTRAQCALVVVIDGQEGTGYSIMGPVASQMPLPDLLQQIADALRAKLRKNLQ